MSLTEEDEKKLSIANAEITNSLINNINKNSSIHSLPFNLGFSSNSSPLLEELSTLIISMQILIPQCLLIMLDQLKYQNMD